jgi:hypothetical protein
LYDNSGLLGGAVCKFHADGTPAEFSALNADVLPNVGHINFSAGEQLAVSQEGPTKGDLYVANASVVEIYDSATGEKLGELFFSASKNGERAFFMTAQALTNDAPAVGIPKIYRYDVTQPAGKRLTLLTPSGGGRADGMSGVSDDGSYAYLIARGPLGKGAPPDAFISIAVWHNGTLTYVHSLPNESVVGENNADSHFHADEARITPDGRHMLFVAPDGGPCESEFGSGCQALFLYSADANRVVCVSCHPGGGPPTQTASDETADDKGCSNSVLRLNHPLSADGSRAFFSTAEALVPADKNSVSDAYEYDAVTGRLVLLSGGTGTEPAYFLDASLDGRRDVFFATGDRLLGWDTNEAVDVYDVRSDGGFPEPTEAARPCNTEETCHGPVGWRARR